MLDKKEEEKYCQENFNSDVEQGFMGFGIGIAIFTPIIIILLLYFNYKKIIRNFKLYYLDEKLKFCHKMILSNDKNLKDCNCTYDGSLINGCFNSVGHYTTNPTFWKDRGLPEPTI
jgi:hypothetical protein